MNLNTEWTVTFHTNTAMGLVAAHYHPIVASCLEIREQGAKERAYANVLISFRGKPQ